MDRLFQRWRVIFAGLLVGVFLIPGTAAASSPRWLMKLSPRMQALIRHTDRDLVRQTRHQRHVKHHRRSARMKLRSFVVVGQPGRLEYDFDNADVSCGLFSPGYGGYGPSPESFGCNSTGLYVGTISPNEVDLQQWQYADWGGWGVQAPAGITISKATAGFSDETNGSQWVPGTGGWLVGTLVNGQPASTIPISVKASDDTSDIGPMSNWGFTLTCGVPGGCFSYADVTANTVEINASETTGPQITASGTNLDNTTGKWVWNPPGDPWPLSATATDGSGVCSLVASLGGKTILSTSGGAPSTSWMVCGNASGSPTVDLNEYPTGEPTLKISATNGAELTTNTSRTIYIDNTPVSVAYSTPNDPNPTVWVNHPVTVDETTTAGPSGVSGTNCSIDGGTPAPYSGPLTVNGTGAHQVSCTGANQAVDAQGAQATTTRTLGVAIDETPPAIAIEPQNPGSPAQVVVDTSDGQSGVTSGSIQIAPAGTSQWTNVPTSLATGHLIGELNDARLNGAYTVQATSCDQAGNCSSTSEQLTLPLRAAVSSQVGWQKLIAPTKIITRRVRVGYRIGHARYHGHRITVKVGGHKRTVKIVVARNHRCAHKRVKIGHHRWRQINVCRHVKVIRRTRHRVLHGRSTKIYGLVSADGVPVADAPVEIRTASNSLGHHWRRIATVRANRQGQWSYKLKPGPSRLIRAFYPGSARLHPDTGTARTIVPAKIKLHITPTILPWSHQITISGHLVGGFVPKKGVVLRFVWVQSKHNHPTKFSFRTDGRGRFRTTFTWGQGTGVQTEDWSVWTYGTDSAYPWSSGRAPKVTVTWGPQTPASMRHPPHPRREHHHRRRHAH